MVVVHTSAATKKKKAGKTTEIAALVQQRIAEKITECTGETDLI